VLDQLGIEYMLANRVAMGRVWYRRGSCGYLSTDALMYPLNSQVIADTPDRKFFYQREAMLLKRYMDESGAATVPGTLEDYIEKVIRPTLERQKKAGQVAANLMAAYLRSFEFQGTGETRHEMSSHVTKRGVPERAGVHDTQDFLFRHCS